MEIVILVGGKGTRLKSYSTRSKNNFKSWKFDIIRENY